MPPRYAHAQHLHEEAALTYRHGRLGCSSWPIAAMLRTICESLSEAFAAHRHYERLRSRGMPHTAALRESLGIGRCASDDA